MYFKHSQKTLMTSLVVASMFVGSPALAHNLWVVGKNEAIFSADMIYGHHFPTPEVIAKERESIFEPIQVIGEAGTETLKQASENYHYESEKPLEQGTYILKAYYKPTAWSEKADGDWVMAKTRKDIADEVKSCGIYSMFGKSIISVGDERGEFATKPLGKGLEITPLEAPNAIVKDKAVKFKITQDGKPVKQTEIFGSYTDFSDNEMSMPFYAKSDLAGEFVFKGLHAGQWYLKASVNKESGNADCEKIGDKTTLTFTVKQL